MFESSELILNQNGSIYHLNLLPDQVYDHIITVGDPDRVKAVSKYFDAIYYEEQKREFHTIGGRIGNCDLIVLSTGIGTDNIDIVFNELDALANIDLASKKKKEKHKTLSFYRIGTSGGLHPHINVDSIVVSQMGLGLDGLLHYYKADAIRDNSLEKKANRIIKEKLPEVTTYAVEADLRLVNRFKGLKNSVAGITLTLPGFYGPQGRQLNAPNQSKSFLDDIKSIEYNDLQITNLEMETAGIYGMSKLLGHKAVSLNAILANRSDKTFSKEPKKLVDNLIKDSLELIVSTID